MVGTVRQLWNAGLCLVNTAASSTVSHECSCRSCHVWTIQGVLQGNRNSQCFQTALRAGTLLVPEPDLHPGFLQQGALQQSGCLRPR